MKDVSIAPELKRLELCTQIHKVTSLGGGSISQAACYSTDKGDYFVKTNSDKNASQWFKAESLALDRINAIVPGLVPRPIYHTTQEHPAFIVTEYVAMDRHRSPEAQVQLGQALAQLHAKPHSQFGFDVTSWCGTTQLDNTWSSDWCSFYKTQRLLPLLNQVKGSNHDLDRIGDLLCRRLEHWLGPDSLGPVAPSLLHGDLWSGNWAMVKGSNRPVIFDPAAYYGHYEVEHGIMKMFGGFSSFDAYDDALGELGTVPISPPEARKERSAIYEAYHHLNHFAMFGGSYASGFIDLVEPLLYRE
ncbi:Protein-ribulosamine 3-kinase, chloroplastic [Choanephora cucurbitarum]|uniref:protein-ribulosamine 3-kinase n=1 Tax=Choanephora cucurbitarum TaxID=101091 RepID=A0A1C7NI91_9FUNG|nr:Protein-ribulosamine 3-kinase, chloroplastic [Choanephora cucurbitarum]